jgi:hypothetical protein
VTAKPAIDSIEFICSIAKVQTLADGGIRVTIDLQEQATETAKKLMDWRNSPVGVVMGTSRPEKLKHGK